MKTRLTVDTLLTTLDDLALQALNASTEHTCNASPWEGDTLKALALQIRHLVQAADAQINA